MCRISQFKKIISDSMVSVLFLSVMLTGCNKEESDGNFYTNAFTSERFIEFSIDSSKQELTIHKDDTNQLESSSNELNAACRYSIRAGTYKYITDGKTITGIIGFDPSEGESDTTRQLDFPAYSRATIILSESQNQRYLLRLAIAGNRFLIIQCESEVRAK